jgi:pyruvate dehydrogenase E2 component (dihydrolipoamide acetyltransferase)
MSEPITFAMPSLGADMDEGRITEWLVQPGDHVERGQIVVVVETDKSDIEVEIFEPAIVAELLVAEGEVVPVGTPIARLHPDRAGAGRPPGVEPAPAERPEPAAEPAVPMDDVGQAEHGTLTSPVLRHLAEELHVDASHLHGSGPGGRVVRDDIVRAARPSRPARAERSTGRRITPRARRLLAERGLSPDDLSGDLGGDAVVTGDLVLAAPAPVQAPPTPAASAPSRQDTMRRHIADLMTRSWREIPHYHVTQRLDLTIAIDRLAATNESRALTDRIVPGALLLCAAARAASKVPQCNGWWHEGRFDAADTVDLGLVLSLRSGGIVVPTIQRANELSPAEMMQRMTELVQQARSGRLRSSHLGEASITVTSLGDRGADSVIGVIHPPQVALVGFGAVRDDLWPSDGGAVVRPTVHASLAADHRATDGLIGSRFLAQLQALLDGAIPAELDDATPEDQSSDEVPTATGQEVS